MASNRVNPDSRKFPVDKTLLNDPAKKFYKGYHVTKKYERAKIGCSIIRNIE